MAPEVVRREQYNKEAEVYCFSLLLYELVVHAEPFVDCRVQHITSAVALHGRRPPLPPGTPAAVEALIKGCWHHVASERPSFVAVQRALASLHATLDDADLDWLDAPLGHPVAATAAAEEDAPML